MGKKTNDPFLPLKYIAYCRSRLTDLKDDFDKEALLDFAKWQICKVRNVLFLDPIWDAYTEEDILIEYFAIRFDESEDMVNEFKKEAFQDTKEQVTDWFKKMEDLHGSKNPAPTPEPEEFEDTFE